MTKFGRIDLKTGDIQDGYTGAFCNFEPVSATVAATAATEAIGAAAAGSLTATSIAAATESIGAVSGGLFGSAAFGATPLVASPGLLAGAFEGLGVRDFLSGGFALFSAAKSVEAGNLAAQSALQNAQFADISAKQELLKGRKEALDLEALTLDEVEQFQAGIGPRGITGSGSARAAQEAAVTASNRQQDFATENAQIRAAADAVRSKSLKIDAKAARTTGVLGAANTLGQFALRRNARR